MFGANLVNPAQIFDSTLDADVLVFNGRLANRGLPSLVKEASGV